MANIKGRCEPAYSIVLILGGVTQTAKICGVTLGAVSRWLSPRGSNGLIPLVYWAKIIDYAQKHNIKISIHDFLGIKS